ncbi:MAG: hypothetical protein R2715_01870 [Ilumatobacteraceae bacterium]
MATKRSRSKKKSPIDQADLFAQPAFSPSPADAVELVERNLLDYALYVIGDRAVPSIADGLPVACLLWVPNGSPPAWFPAGPP